MLGFCLSMTACATLITGKKQVIHVVSQPSGAQVHFYRILSPEFIPNVINDSAEAEENKPYKPRINDWTDSAIHCTTPCYVRVPRLQSDTLVMVINKPGYLTKEHRFKKRWNEASALNFLIPWNWMVDANNGAVIRYPQPDTLVLEEIQKRQ